MFDRAVLELAGARRTMAALGALALAQAALVLGQAWALALALSNLWAGSSVESQAFAIAAFAACLFLRQAALSAQDAVAERFAAARAAEERGRLLGAVFAEGPALVQRAGTGNVTTLALEGVEQVETYLALILPKMVRGAVLPAVLLVFAFAVDWVTGTVMAVFLPVTAFYLQLMGKTAKDAASARHEEFELLSNHFADTLRGMDTLRAFGHVARHAREVFCVSERFREATVRTLRVAALSGAVLDVVSVFSLAAVAIMLGFRLIDGSMSLFPALFALIVVPEYYVPIRQFAADYHASLDGKNALAALRRLTGSGAVDGAAAGTPAGGGAAAASALGVAAPAAPASGAPASGRFAKASAPCVSSWGASSRLELSGVGLSYDDHRVLSDVSFCVEGACAVGIVGASGSGKSTLASMLAGFLDPEAGEVRVCGCDLGTLRRDDWLRQATYLPQTPYLFHATLRENVAFYRPDATDEEVRRAVAAAGLSSVVEELPCGLETVVGEGARALSGGQAQRVALARAVLDDARRVLVFDEPTAHLDIETELELKERMIPLFAGRLVFFATHRLHWLDNMDYVLVLEDGRVAQFGRPADLAAQDGALARLIGAGVGDVR